MTAPLRRHTEHSAQVRDEAARRALRQHDGAPPPAAAAAELQDWRQADSAHAQAMDDALHALRLLDCAAGSDEIAAMRADALAARPERHRHLRWPAAGVAALALIIAVAWLNGGRIAEPARLAFTAAPAAPANTYSTGIGERSTVSLPDGSVAILNTDSQLEVAYAADQRIVRLMRGQAIFEVAKDAARPFRVLAAGKRITAVGTEFDVRIDRDRLQVALLHGVVKVDGGAPGQAADAATQMVAGDVLAADEHQMRLSRGDPERISSWREGQVVFNDESLAGAVAEINRYSTKPIQIDPALALAQRYFVSGVFKTGDTERFAHALTELFALKLAHDEAGRPLIGTSSLTKDSQ